MSTGVFKRNPIEFEKKLSITYLFFLFYFRTIVYFRLRKDSAIFFIKMTYDTRKIVRRWLTTLDIFNFIWRSLSFETWPCFIRAKKYHASNIIFKYATFRKLSQTEVRQAKWISSPLGFSSNGLSGMSKIFKQQQASHRAS